jgi:hypothetical protein
MNEIFHGTTTEDRRVSAKALVWMPVTFLMKKEFERRTRVKCI